MISRSGEDNYDNLERHKDAAVIVNATPVGMYPNTAAAPVDLRQFPACEGVLDLIYNPFRTALLQQAEALDIPNLGGLYMLVEQARCAASSSPGRSSPPSAPRRSTAPSGGGRRTASWWACPAAASPPWAGPG